MSRPLELGAELEARFWLKVDVRGEDECWLWKAAKNEHGYGRFRVGKQASVYAHRLAWEMVHGPIPEGMFVLHACDTPACVNVAHLSLGTRQENVRDMVAKGRHGQTRLKRKRLTEKEKLADAASELFEAVEALLWAYDRENRLMMEMAVKALRTSVAKAAQREVA